MEPILAISISNVLIMRRTLKPFISIDFIIARKFHVYKIVCHAQMVMHSFVTFSYMFFRHHLNFTFISNIYLGLSTTKDLLSKSVLRYSAWMMAFITCLGNSLVLWGRYTQRDENRALSIVIRNLAVSDMLMGFYLSFIAIQDHRFREQYHFNSMEWVTSWSCIVIGMLAVTSSEVSLLILTFISIERFLLIAGPFNSRRRLNTNNIQLCLFAIWLSGGTIALFPGIQWTYK